MKRIIITSLLSACFISMSAQEKTKLDPWTDRDSDPCVCRFQRFLYQGCLW